MVNEMNFLIFTSISIACLHTITGPDHYLPFIALSKSRGWSYRKTLSWTIICGCAHVWSSVLLGLGGIAVGWCLAKLSWMENVRGGFEGWLLLFFGLAYGIWGLIRAYQDKPHKHFDSYENGDIYVYEHRHRQTIQPPERYKVTPWALFLIFLLGPCEPMIPLLAYPAARNSWLGIVLLIAIYTVVTILTMILMVTFGYYGISFLNIKKAERFVHALGGATILICGVGMLMMGW